MAWIAEERVRILVLGLCIFFAADIAVSGLECGYPGSPVHGRSVPVRSSYAPGTSVGFTCFFGYTLLGNLKRVCLHNGTWSGRTPICDRSLPGMDQHASSRATLEMYDAQKAIDGHRDTCTYTDKKRPRWVRVDMRNPHLVQAVAVTVPKSAYLSDNAQFTIYVISVKDATTASYHKCADFNGKFSTPTVKLPCSGAGIYGSYVHVEDNRKNIDYFSICEIEIFVQKDSYECGEVDRPANSYTTNPEAGIVEYKCMHGFQLLGPKRRRCLPNGQWSGSQPLCKEIVCPLLDEVPHGVLHYEGPSRGPPRQDTMANVTCDYGFYPSGRPLKCLENGQWSEGTLSCQPVDCQLPSTSGSQKFFLLNGTTTYGSVALFYCDKKAAQPNETVPMLTCREDGKWFPSIDCTIPRRNSAISTLELIDEEENAVPNGVVIGMAVVVFLLLLVLILIILLKRKQLLQRANSGSLPSKETTPSDESGGTPYENEAFYSSVSLEEQKRTPADGAKGRGVERGILATILFAKRKLQGSSEKSSNDADSSGKSCFYEDIGVVSGGPAPKRESEADGSSQPVYAQVDLQEKRRSRLAKALTDHLDTAPVPERDPREGFLDYDSELDSEPIKLRELPPIPDDEQSSGTYASLSRPLSPPTTPSFPRGLHEADHYMAIMKDNELYSTA